MKKDQIAVLHPIAPHSQLGRWIAAQDWVQLTSEEALAEFGLLLRLGKN